MGFDTTGLQLTLGGGSSKVVVGRFPVDPGDIDRLKGWNYHCWTWKFDAEFRVSLARFAASS